MFSVACFFTVHEHFDMVCSTTLVTRAALQGGLEPETAFSLSDFYIQKASRMKHPSDLTIISTQMLLDFTERMSKLKKRQAVYSLPIQKCINYISLHFHEKITVQQLSKYTHMSISHLSRIFKSETGISIQGFIQNTRINEAKELLLNTDYPFSTISKERTGGGLNKGAIFSAPLFSTLSVFPN